MLEIKFDPSTLSKAQRDDLASFILGWGTDEEYDNLGTAVTSNCETLQITSSTGKLEPGAVITGMVNGVVTEAPKSVPSSADASPSTTAPVDTQASTSAANAPLPPVPQPGLPVNTAAHQSPNLAEVDSKGMPWDERIHSSSRAKVAGGTWKYKRGVSEEEIKRVEDELHNPSLEELFTVPAPGSGIAPPPPTATGSAGGNGMVVPAGVTTNPEVDLRKEFAQLMIRVANAKGSGKITAEEVTTTLAAHGVPSLPMLSTKLDQVPAVAAAIDALIASRG